MLLAIRNLGLLSFCMVFYVVYVIARGIQASNRKINKNRLSFLDRESKANSVRRADISELSYIAIPYDRLPIDSVKSEKLEGQVKELIALRDKKILDLSSYTNTDLKLMYGPANLDELTVCDLNYTSLIRILDSLGNGLIEEDTASAAAFFEYAIEIGSDITSTYMGLSDIYIKQNDKSKIQDLIIKADKIKSLSGPTIKHKLEDKLSKM